MQVETVAIQTPGSTRAASLHPHLARRSVPADTLLGRVFRWHPDEGGVLSERFAATRSPGESPGSTEISAARVLGLLGLIVYDARQEPKGCSGSGVSDQQHQCSASGAHVPSARRLLARLLPDESLCIRIRYSIRDIRVHSASGTHQYTAFYVSRLLTPL